MDDLSHLDALIGEQTDPIAIRLVEAFRTLYQRPDVSPSEYSAKLREVMEQLLADHDETAKPHRS